MIITGKRVVDADFRGEIMVIIINNGPNEFTIIKHERVAKLITKIIQETKIEIIGKLNDTTVTTQTEKNKCSEEQGVLAYQTDGDTVIL